MGMYTEMLLTCDLKRDTRKDIIEWLEAMVDSSKEWDDVEKLSPNEMVDTRFREGLLGGSYYFYGQPMMEFEYDKISKTYHLTVLTNIKNYDNDIERFMNLIIPFIKAFEDEMLGYVRYEEDKLPTAMIWNGNEIEYIKCAGEQR
jgi:hypothetical protein